MAVGLLFPEKYSVMRWFCLCVKTVFLCYTIQLLPVCDREERMMQFAHNVLYISIHLLYVFTYTSVKMVKWHGEDLFALGQCNCSRGLSHGVTQVRVRAMRDQILAMDDVCGTW